MVWADEEPVARGVAPIAGDRELVLAAKIVVRDALDRVEVHPCDEHNDSVKANNLSVEMKALYDALVARGAF